MDLAALLRTPTSTLAEVCAILDPLDHAARYAAFRGCGMAELGRLYDIADPNIDDTHFVGQKGPLEPVTHDGWNSLPLPAFARTFQKVFCRPEPGGSPRIFGYNEGSLRYLIGPGYFQLVPTAGNAEFAPRGAWVVDYHQVPDSAVAPQWPWVVPNWVGPQVLVYGGTRDFMRKVNDTICVGKPWGRAGAMPFCFILVRRD